MDLIDFSRYFAALLVVLGLLGGFALLVRSGWIPGSIQGFSGFSSLTGPRAERRLAVKETLILDPRRRVVIVKSDGEEHVLLLGPERETVLSTRPAKPEPVFEPVAPDEGEMQSRDAEPPARAEAAE